MRGRVERQVEGILEGNGLKWFVDPEGKFSLRFDSALVQVTLVEWGAQTIIQLRSDVLRGLDDATTADVLVEVNRLNCVSTFGKWAFYGDDRVIALEYDLLADHLQEAELMTALAAVARLADGHDDSLQTILGGLRAFEET